jgi:MYXO-CTERM domain-containing protein
MRRSMDKALTTGTVSGWSRGKTKDTEDGMTILPKNAATAALYTYTPWVGEAGGGKKGVGGVSLHAQVWDRFAESVSYGAWAPPASSNASNTEQAEPDAGAADPAPTEDPPIDNGGGEEPTPEADAAPAPRADAGPTGEGSSTGSGTKPGADGGTTGKGAPEDGSEDGNILGEGSAPPASNAPPPSTKSKTPSRPEELPEASEEELAAKKKSDAAGCSTTGQGGGSSNGLLIAGAAALAIVASRRRRA